MKNKKQQYELIAPAGSVEKARYALLFGADSIYLGVPDFSLRVRINKFDEKSIEEMVDYAHRNKKKVYVTVNIYAHNRHIKKLPKYLKKIEDWNVDGIIVSDVGVINLAKKYCPQIPIHLSTQASCTNFEAAKFWFDLGVKRIVLAREVTLEEIKEIHKKIPKLELEYFAHGAMCMSYSGRCLLSSFFVGRSANLGDCVQPCRWNYEVSQKSKVITASAGSRLHSNKNLSGGKSVKCLDNNIFLEAEGHDDKKMRIEEDCNGSYILNSKDLCLVKYLEELKDAGVTSFKIEGRAKSVYYVALVSQIYKKALSLSGSKGQKKRELNKLFKELQTLTHRDYTTGFLFGKETVEQRYCSSHIISKYEFVGEVMESVKCKVSNKKYCVFVKVHNALFVGDSIEIIEPSGLRTRIKIKKLFDSDGQEIKEAHGGQEKQVILKLNKKIQSQAVIRKKI